MPPVKPGYSITIKPDSREEYRFPDGEVWAARIRRRVGERRFCAKIEQYSQVLGFYDSLISSLPLEEASVL